MTTQAWQPQVLGNEVIAEVLKQVSTDGLFRRHSARLRWGQ